MTDTKNFDLLQKYVAEAAQREREAQIRRELEAANYLLAAGSCDVEGGKIGDERGNFYCTKVAEMTRQSVTLIAQAAELAKANALLREAHLWLEGCLKCETFHWDGDQWQAATETITGIDAHLEQST